MSVDSVRLNMSADYPALSGFDWNAIPTPAMHHAELRGNVLFLDTTLGELRVSIGTFGIRIQSGPEVSQDYGMLVQDMAPSAITLATTDTGFEAFGSEYALQLDKDTLAMRFQHRSVQFQQSASDGHFTREYRLPPLARVDGGWLIALELGADEAVYGLGEKWGKLNHRGEHLRSFNHDALGVNAERSYKNTPFCWSPRGWGSFVHTPAAVSHSVGFAPWSQRAYVAFVEDQALDITLFAGQSPAELIKHYASLTGFSATPPSWSLGTILSKAYYRDADELLETAREVRRRKMPCDTITLDGRAWQDTATRFAFEWDASRYPEPAKVIDELKAMHFRVCLWEYPLVSTAHPLHTELAAKGWLLKDRRSGKAYEYHWDPSPFGEVLTELPPSGILDFTHPDAYAFWRDAHKPLFAMGIDMIKADFGEQLDDANMLAHNGDTGLRLHNVYSLLYNRCVYEAATKYSQSGAFLFSRAAWIGSQRYPAQWGGDPQADWQGLAASIRGGLSWGLSGGPLFATDVGGFYRDERDSELYVRWAQAAVFSAHIRLHGVGPREPWSYGQNAEAAVLNVLHLRYRLLPYLQQTLKEASRSGLPVQRAMVLAFPDQPQLWAFEHQYLFGNDMLFVPCLEAGGRVRFFLPQGDWKRFPTGEAYAGNNYYEETFALHEYAVFVADGTHIVLGPNREYSDEPVSAEDGVWIAGRDTTLPA